MFCFRLFPAPVRDPADRARPAPVALDRVRRALRSLRRLAAPLPVVLALLAAFVAPNGVAAQESGDLRLIETTGEAGKGRLQVYYDGRWGHVCDDYFDIKDARVACWQLGYSGAEEAIKQYGASRDFFWLDNLQCTGKEDRIGDCPREFNRDWGEENCSREEAAGVRCTTAGFESQVQLSRHSMIVTPGQRAPLYRVRLFSEPSGDVTVTPATTSTAIAFDPASLTFTQSNWSVRQSIAVSAVSGATYDGHAATVTHTVTGAGSDGLAPPSLNVTVRDPDGRGVKVSASSLALVEGSPSRSYEVRLLAEPSGDVTVTPATTSTAITLAPASLTFTQSNWRKEQSVEVTAVDDAAHDDHEATVTHSVAGANYAGITASPVTVTVHDPDRRAVNVSPKSLTVDEDGPSKSYTMRLRTKPTGDVTVTPATTSAAITFTPASLTFTPSNWSDLQSVEVTAVDDAAYDDHEATVTHGVAGADYASITAPDVTVTVRDPDPRGGEATPDRLTVTEGDTTGAQYGFRLKTLPTGTVTVTVTIPADAPVEVSPATLAFTVSDWDTEQHVTVTALDDDDTSNETVTLDHSASGGGYGSAALDSVRVKVLDDDLLVTGAPGTLTFDEGAAGQQTYALRLTGAPSGPVEVDIVAGPHLSVRPRTLEFTASNWDIPRTVTVTQTAGQDDDAVDETTQIRHLIDGDEQEAQTVAVTIVDDDEAGVAVSPHRLTIAEGGSGQYGLALTAAPRGTATVTVTVTGAPPAGFTVSPQSFDFTAADWDTERTVTVTTVHDADHLDETVTLSHAVTPAYSTAPVNDVNVTVEDDDEPAILTGPPSADTVWWGTFRAGSNGAGLLGYVPNTGVGYLSDTEFDYAGATRKVLAIYLLPGGSLNVELDMGDADALPDTMTLHLGNDALALSDARHIEHAATGTYPFFHWYKWTQPGVDWEADEAMGIWLTGPVSGSLPGAPTGLVATPVAGGVRLDWDAPSDDGGSAIAGYQFQADDGGGDQYWWPTGSAATTYTETPLRSGVSFVFRVRAVNAMGNGAASAPTGSVRPLAVNHAPVGSPRVVGRAAPDALLKTKMATVEDANGMETAEFQYQWMRSPGPSSSTSTRGVRNGAQPIPGATEKTYQMRAQDIGTYVTVRVTYTDDSGFTETVESEPRLLEETLLTGWLTAVPGEHDGSSAFTLRLRLSEALGTGAVEPVAESFAVSGGAVEAVRRLGQEGWKWEVEVAPSGDAAVVVSVPVRSDCAAAGTICTGDGRALSNAIEHTVPGPVSVSVADARAREGEDEAMRFVAVLSRAVDRTVSVDYATADGTAHAGSDYEAASGTLSFAPGETERAVAVALLDDLLDEGEETFTLRLDNAVGAKLGDGEATGTIENSDPLQQAWLAQFGGTVAGQVVDAIAARLDASGGSHVTLAGHGLDAGDGKAWEEAFEPGGKEAVEEQTLSGREAALRSAFRLSSDGDGSGGGVWTAWGRMVASAFTSNDGELDLDGEVATGLLGIDVEGGRWLAGAALSHSRGEGTFGFADGAGDKAGKVESELTGIHPYARLRLNERVSMWGVAGHGTGTLTLPGACAGSGDVEMDLAMTMGALGLRGTVLEESPEGGPALGVRSDVTWSRSESAGVTDGRCGNTEGARARTSRMRVVLDGARTWALGRPGRTLTPALELGLRQDAGDAASGLGIEAGARVRYRDEEAGLTLEGAVRALLAHEDGGYEEWGASASAVLHPGSDRRGLSVRLAPGWGAASSGMDRLWSARDASEWAQGARGTAGGRLDAEFGYGVGGPFARGVLTPYTGLTVSDGGGRAWRAGGRWEAAHRLRMSLEGRREEGVASGGSDDSVMLRGALRW